LVAAAIKKIRRRRAAGELAVAQTRDLAQAAKMLSAAGMLAEGLESSGGCYLMAYVGAAVAGVVGIEVRVDAALIRSLMVVDGMRRRGVGAALVAAARTAAHTRGARTLYALASDSDSARYFARFGFAPAALEEVLEALAGTFMADYVRQHRDECTQLRTLSLDIANDGVIER
jgi:N-acetylglutamate synthase-like GNAT family acetyltransferase